MLMAISLAGCANQLQLAQQTLGAVVPYADAKGDFSARASVEHVYADARAGARIGLYIHGLGQVWELCRETETFGCEDTDTDPGVAGEWVYDILIFEDGEGNRRLQMRPTPADQIPMVRAKLGLPPPMPGLNPKERGVLPESPVFALPDEEPDFIPPPPPPPTKNSQPSPAKL